MLNPNIKNKKVLSVTKKNSEGWSLKRNLLRSGIERKRRHYASYT